MEYHFRHRVGLLIATTLLLAACAGPAASTPTAQPPAASVAPSAQPTATASTAAAATQPPAATQAIAPTAAAPTEPPAEGSATETPETTAQPLADVEGEIVLQLSAGNGPDQVGISGAAPEIVGPRSFRIGADGSIRLLDNVNRRILFFGQDGVPARALDIKEAQNPIDFIVNNAGEVFVYDGSDGSKPQVLRYGPDGKLTAELAVSPGVSTAADGIMLTAAQDLMLVQGNQTYWSLLHSGVAVPPQIQPLTMHEGAATPRSPTIFRTSLDETGAPYLHIVALTGGIAGDMMVDVDGRQINLPPEARFFNVDRAMNLYFTRISPDADATDVWRVLPDGSIAGGAHILSGACRSSWRTMYVDQAGSAWSLCVGEQGATVKRYTLLDGNSQPLEAAPQQAADVPWKPGASFSAA